MGPFETGVVYELNDSKKDRVHVETCGLDQYIIFIADRDNSERRCLVAISRNDAEDLCRNLLIHIEKTKMFLGDCE